MQKRLIFIALAVVSALAIWSHAQESAKQNRRYIKLALPGNLTTVPFSHGVLVGDTLYLSGTLSIDPKTGKPPTEVEQEARIAMDSFVSVLKEANMTPDDLVSVTVYCTDLSQYAKFNNVYRSYFKKDFPARAFIGAGNLLFGAKFEIQGIAVRK